MKVLLSCLLAYCSAFGLSELIIRHSRPHPRPRREKHACARFWCRMTMRVFGSVSVTRTLLAASALYFVGGSIAVAIGLAPETGEKEMSNFADGYATAHKDSYQYWPPFPMVFRRW